MSSIKGNLLHKLSAFILFSVLFISLPSVPLYSSPGLTWNNLHFDKPERFVFRDETAVGSFEGLDATVREIETSVEKWNENGHRKAALISDYQAVFPFPIDAIIPVFLDHENEDRVYPRIIDSRDLSPEADRTQPHFQEIRISFKFLGVGENYHYILYRVPEWYEDGSFMLKWALVHSVDRKYFELYGSWYLQEFTRDGTPHTYLRNFVQTGLVDPPGMLQTITSLFSRSGVQNFFDAVYEAVQK